MLSVLAFAAVLAIVIGFHEMAHLTVAKLFGVKVIRFSLGFGPVIVKRKIGETEYVVSLLPLGGYVQPLSRDLLEEEQEPAHPEKYFESKPAWQRFLIFLAGPLSNLLLSCLLLIGLCYFVGVPVKSSRDAVLGEVFEGSPAAEAGLKPKDKILAVNGEEISSWDSLVEKIRAGKGKAVKLKVERANEFLEISVLPKEQETPEGKKFLVGIAPELIYEKPGLVKAVRLGAIGTWKYTMIFADFFKKVLKLEAERTSVGGIIMIGQATHQAASRGLVALAELLIFLSLNLFVFNILPIPLLDGGQLYPALFEMATGIKPNKKFLYVWQLAGLVLLLAIFLLGFYNDLERLTQK
ncbi:MAG: RIP metalloprotease RseP [Candidatus Harrisonbacteria bacterium]|nr:RIP metalloprotease RseP [Candidatus Harrisonbacteria bacterium]